MRLVKLVGCVAFLALSALITFGAATATASEGTILCTENEEPCQPLHRYQLPTVLKGQLVKSNVSTFETNEWTVKCTESSWAGEMTSENETLNGAISSLAFGGCTSGETKCTVAPTGLPVSMKMKAIEAGNGAMTLTSSSGGETGVSVECGKTIKCTLSGKPELSFTGGKPGKVEASKDELAGGGLFCPKSGNWSAPYELTAPAENAFLRKGKTDLCQIKQAVCKPENKYKEGTEVEASASGVTLVVDQVITVHCKSSGLGFELLGTAQGQRVATKSLSFIECVEEDHLKQNCTVTASNLNYGGEIKATNKQYDGTLVLEIPTITIKCALLAECSFSLSLSLDITGDETAKVKAVEEFMPAPGGVFCQKSMSWSAEYSLTKPKPFYVTG
jgi:hypothetical protein